MAEVTKESVLIVGRQYCGEGLWANLEPKAFHHPNNLQGNMIDIMLRFSSN